MASLYFTLELYIAYMGPLTPSIKRRQCPAPSLPSAIRGSLPTRGMDEARQGQGAILPNAKGTLIYHSENIKQGSSLLSESYAGVLRWRRRR